MNAPNGVSVGSWGDSAIHCVRFNAVMKSRVEGLLHGPRARGGRDHPARGVLRLQGAGEKLGAQEGKVVRYRENLGLVVKVVHVSSFDAPRGDAQSIVLDHLEFVKR